MDIVYLDMTHISLCHHIMKLSNVKLLFLLLFMFSSNFVFVGVAVFVLGLFKVLSKYR